MEEIRPVPKPRQLLTVAEGAPVPLPRSHVPPPVSDRVSASDILRSIGTVSKQITEDVAQKVTTSAKNANEKIEKSIIDGSKFARDTLEKTLVTSKAVRDSVTKSVVEGTKTAGMRLRRSKKSCSPDGETNPRCVSMPAVDVTLFDNIQFHSPLEKKKHNEGNLSHVNQDLPNLNLNSLQFDELSLFSNNSDSNADTVSNFSYDSRESEQHNHSMNLENEQLAYDTPRTSRANSFVSTMSTPEVPERRKKRKSNISYMRDNSIYENWTLQVASPETNTAPPQSTVEKKSPPLHIINEFDPLKASTDKPISPFSGLSNELILLQTFLIGDTYGTIISNTSNDTSDDAFDFVEKDYFNPPTPPERDDSLPLEKEDDAKVPHPTDKDGNSNWFVGLESGSKTSENEDVKHVNTSVMQRFSNMLKLDSVRSKTAKTSVQKTDIVDRPSINSQPTLYHSGLLSRIISGVVEDLFKNSQVRYCSLSDQKIICYTDATYSVLKETYTLDTVYSLQICLPLSASINNSYCFELSMSTGTKGAPRKILFSCASAAERRNWAQKIAENLTGAFQTNHTAEFTRIGWCYLKEGVSGEWRGAWLLLTRRLLLHATGAGAVGSVDLRKTRCVVTQEADEETKRQCPGECNETLLLDCPAATLHLRLPHEKELKGWRYMIKLAAHNNGSHIHHQQLTRDDVPTIVDKCISFIYAHGTLSEGIYRRAGRASAVSELLGRFRRDSWAVQLSPDQHSEHDIAEVLKRFFRDLPEPLIPADLQKPLQAALAITDDATRVEEYRRIMSSLPLVSRRTARKLFAHLHFVHTMAHANKMAAENLAYIWAPTVMPQPLQNNIETAFSAKEACVIRDFIARYEDIWTPTDAEKLREATIKTVLTRVLSSAAPLSCKAAGDLRAWVYIHDRNSCHQVTLTPNKTSVDLCVELCDKTGLESHQLMLQEVVCNDSLRRVVHLDEIVLDVVLRWSYWDEEDRKHNYLVVTENKILHDMEMLRYSAGSVCGELRFANEATKTFKLHMFECQNSKLCYFKDKQGSHKIEEWNLNDIIWYLGHEPKRNPQSRWAITFIPKGNKHKRSKERPWFGCTVAGAVTSDHLRWLAAMTFSQHSQILPTPALLMTQP